MTFNIQEAVKDILSFMQEAGALALKNQDVATHDFKGDSTIVTETDLAITKLVKERLAHWFEKEGHLLVDEESIEQVGTPEEVFANSTYQWVLDPIDGTSTYAAGLSNWSISLGISENGQPLAGVIYLPALNELYVAFREGEAWTAYSEHKAFTDAVVTKDLQINRKPIHHQSQMNCQARYLKGEVVQDHTHKLPYLLVHHWGCVANMGWVAGGKLAAHVTQACWWDVAAGWALIQAVGGDFYNVHTGESYSVATAETFTKDWKLAHPVLVCLPEQKEALVGCFK